MRRTRFRRMAVHKYLLLMMGFLIFGMGIGYAAISQTLEIDGTTDIDRSSWNVHFANVLVSDGSVAADTPTITDSTSVSFSVNLDNPGDFYEFKVDVKNDGTMNSKIDSYQVLPVLTAEQQEFFEYTVTYVDGTPVQVGDALNAGSQETLLIRFHYKELNDTSLYPTDDVDFDFSVSLNYIQGNGTAIDHPTG